MDDPILDQTLREFSRGEFSLEVQLPGMDHTIWFVPDTRASEALQATGVKIGRIWKAAELFLLVTTKGITHEDAVAIAKSRVFFNATVEQEARRR